MSEKKDITRAPPYDFGEQGDQGELYGVKTNPGTQGDAVFGEVSEDGPNFKSVCASTPTCDSCGLLCERLTL